MTDNYVNRSDYHDEELSASDPSGKTDVYTPVFDYNKRQERDAMTRDISQSAPDSTGGYGNTGVPGNTTTADTLFGGGSSDSYARGGAGAATGARQDRDHDDDNTVPTSSGNFAQSALDRAAGFGSTSVPGDTTTDRTLSETDDSVESSTGKPSIGQRLKSGVEKIVRKGSGDSEHSDNDDRKIRPRDVFRLM